MYANAGRPMCEAACKLQEAAATHPWPAEIILHSMKTGHIEYAVLCWDLLYREGAHLSRAQYAPSDNDCTMRQEL